MRYAIIIEKAESNFAAHVPDLPGCVAIGKTLEETQQRVREVIESHIRGLRQDGMPIPIPSGQVDYVEVHDIRPPGEMHVLWTKEQEYYETVQILECGGTINMSAQRKPSSRLDNFLDEIRKKMKKRLQIRFAARRVFDRPPDSSNIGEKEWDLIFEEIKNVLDKKKNARKFIWQKSLQARKGGIVITHGTDTLQICSFVIGLKLSLHELTLPVIFTASHSPPDQDGSDAVENIKKSLFLAMEKAKATEEETLPPGVYVLIGEELHLASRISKLYTKPNSEGKYFFSFPAPVAFVSSEGEYSFHLQFDRDYLRRVQGVAPEELRNFVAAVPLSTAPPIFENGNLLMVLGADSEVQVGWDTAYMKRRTKMSKQDCRKLA